jgi:fructose-1,6-bisphosphatase/sedoheptulose 1,7-bisphosphatase-like protein
MTLPSFLDKYYDIFFIGKKTFYCKGDACMKTQIHNKGELEELKVMIEKEIKETFVRMSKHTNIPIEDLVVIALKRFRSSHGDYDPQSSHNK